MQNRTGADPDTGQPTPVAEKIRAAGARGRVASARSLLKVLVGAALVTVVIGLLLASLTGQGPGAEMSAPNAAASSSSRASATSALPALKDVVSSPAPTSEAEVSASASSSAPSPRSDDQGIVHTDTTGTGTYTVAKSVPQPSGVPQAVYSYVLQTEDGSGVNADEIAPAVMEVLNDPRGWGSLYNVSFKQVENPADAGFIISVATPGTVDSLCAPLSTEGTWSCQSGASVLLSSDRWTYGVPWFSDMSVYHQYMLNHEVGHFLGHRHEPCGGAGLKAPVMLQQSAGIDQCVVNPWPTQDGQPG